MADEKKTPETDIKVSRSGGSPIEFHPNEWLHDWHHIIFPLRNGASIQDYKPKIEKYIKVWLDLVNDIDLNGTKYKLKDFDFVPVGIGSSEFKVVATPEEIPLLPSHLIPPPPPPPPR